MSKFEPTSRCLPKIGWTHTALASLLVALASLLVLACGGPVTDYEDAPRQTADNFSMVVVSRTPSPVPGGLTDDVRVNAFFARYAAFSPTQVLDIINLSDAPDPQMRNLTLGACLVSERNLASGIESMADSFVDLLDAGDLQVHFSNRGSTRLRRRAFPDLFSNVSGVTYQSAGIDGAGSEIVQITSRGSSQAESFAVTLHAVAIPMLHSVAGQPVTSNYAAIDWHEPLDLEWAPAPDPSAETYIELAALQYDRIIALQCRATDTGLATLPRAGVEAVATLAKGDATVRLSVRRLKHTVFGGGENEPNDAYYVSRDSVFLK